SAAAAFDRAETVFSERNNDLQNRWRNFIIDLNQLREPTSAVSPADYMKQVEKRLKDATAIETYRAYHQYMLRELNNDKRWLQEKGRLMVLVAQMKGQNCPNLMNVAGKGPAATNLLEISSGQIPIVTALFVSMKADNQSLKSFCDDI